MRGHAYTEDVQGLTWMRGWRWKEFAAPTAPCHMFERRQGEGYEGLDFDFDFDAG